MRVSLLAVLGVIAIAGCGPARAPREPAVPLSAERRAQLIRRLPPTRRVVLTPEGTRVKTTFDRFIGPCSLMTGYLPRGWIATTPAGCRRLVIRPVFDGRALTSASVTVDFAPASADSATVCDMAVAENLIAWQWRDEPREAWTLREADFARWVGLKHTVGRSLIGRHAGRYFWVSVHMPLEAADRILPRVRALLGTWIWTDTGEPLDPGHSRALSGRKLPGD